MDGGEIDQYTECHEGNEGHGYDAEVWRVLMERWEDMSNFIGIKRPRFTMTECTIFGFRPLLVQLLGCWL